MPVSNSRVRRLKDGQKGNMIDWSVIKEAYCYRSDKPSFRQLGKEFSIDHTWACKKAQREGWSKLKETHWAKVAEKVKDKFLDKAVDERTQQMTILQTVLEKYIDDLSQGRIKVTTNEIVNAMKHMILLMGGITERTELQGINFAQAINILNQQKGIGI